MSIPFIDLQTQRARLQAGIDRRLSEIMAHGRFILGPEVTEFETALAAFGNAERVVSCANGTDALILPMMAWEIGVGDAVFCPSFTYCATAEAIALLGATPVFVDIDRQTYTLDPDSLRQAVRETRDRGGLTPRAIISVDLFGQPADYPAVSKIAKVEGLKLIADSAQGFGCTLEGRQPLDWSDVATTSFFPAKPLGCYGDGGAILTNDSELADQLVSLRFHGRSDVPGDTARIGLNSRLDTIQAGVLLEKLSIFSDEIAARNRIAARYAAALAGHVSRIPA
ncbi:MAG: aminotransferase class I/II-fold pyridoxal phosphate-dependent enzyme, partial [Pseudomonadota bacterium]